MVDRLDESRPSSGEKARSASRLVRSATGRVGTPGAELAGARPLSSPSSAFGMSQRRSERFRGIVHVRRLRPAASPGPMSAGDSRWRPSSSGGPARVSVHEPSATLSHVPDAVRRSWSKNWASILVRPPAAPRAMTVVATTSLRRPSSRHASHTQPRASVLTYRSRGGGSSRASPTYSEYSCEMPRALHRSATSPFSRDASRESWRLIDVAPHDSCGHHDNPSYGHARGQRLPKASARRSFRTKSELATRVALHVLRRSYGISAHFIRGIERSPHTVSWPCHARTAGGRCTSGHRIERYTWPRS